MRVAVGGFSHETNTFNVVPTTLDTFKSKPNHMTFGREVFDTMRNSRSEIGGFIDAGERLGLDLIPIFHAGATPNTGLIARDAFDYIASRLLEGFKESSADAYYVSLHGAAAADGQDDPEGYILKELRDAVGDKPIVATFDLHANTTKKRVENCDILIGYKTAPHIDMYDRGAEAAKAMHQLLKGAIRPTMAYEKVPILIAGGLMTVVDTPLDVVKPSLSHIMLRAKEHEKNPKVLNVTVAAGFGHADVPDAGVSVVVTTDNDPALAQKVAKDLSELAWRLRRGFLWDLVVAPVDVAVRQALFSEETPVILADQGDNTAGGGPGDATFLLQAFKEAGWPDAALSIRDVESVNQAFTAGVGATLTLRMGGKSDKMHGAPVEAETKVRLISDGTQLHHRGLRPFNLGRTAVVECGSTAIVLTEYPTDQANPQFFRVVGIEPKCKHIVVVKSAHRFRHAFQVAEPIAKRVIEVDTPGITSPNVYQFNYRKVRRPIFPLDDM